LIRQAFMVHILSY